MATIQYITDGGPDGTVFGRSATSLVGFFGATPASQASVVAAVATTAVATTAFGFTTSAQAVALFAAVNSILACLKTAGLMATA